MGGWESADKTLSRYPRSRAGGVWKTVARRPPETVARPTDTTQPSISYAAAIDYLDLADRLWPILGPLMRGHAAVYRVTGGRIGAHVPGLPSLLLLDHRGAKSGKLRTTPLVYMPAGDSLLIVASKGGHPQDPAWMHNLRAHPDTEVQIGRRRIEVHAREATREERERLWPKAAEYNPHWGSYRQRTTREIPLVLLEPR